MPAPFDFTATQGDNDPIWRSQLSDEVGVVDFSTATGVQLKMTGRRTATLIDRSAQFDLTVLGVVFYQFLAADLAVPDIYDASWTVTYATGLRITYPTPAKQVVLIAAELG